MVAAANRLTQKNFLLSLMLTEALSVVLLSSALISWVSLSLSTDNIFA